MHPYFCTAFNVASPETQILYHSILPVTHTATALTTRTMTIRDNQVFDIIRNELERQRAGIELIASENFTSLQVMQATGSVMTNKYAEGYPGRRYYGGCEFVDETEQLAI